MIFSDMLRIIDQKLIYMKGLVIFGELCVWSLPTKTMETVNFALSSLWTDIAAGM